MALMSGRALSDIRERAAIAGLVYAGNQGWRLVRPTLPAYLLQVRRLPPPFFGQVRPGAVTSKKEARSVMRL